MNAASGPQSDALRMHESVVGAGQSVDYIMVVDVEELRQAPSKACARVRTVGTEQWVRILWLRLSGVAEWM
jgi:hypothetical protein